MRAADVYRIAVIKATLGELEKAMQARKEMVLRSKGSWRIRAMGIDDAIEILRVAKKALTEPPNKDKS